MPAVPLPDVEELRRRGVLAARAPAPALDVDRRPRTLAPRSW
ncbi:hypothetical protein [Streptomyces kanasensis]|nr:hypothetical protein [Streptomyces kanasensis]